MYSAGHWEISGFESYKTEHWIVSVYTSYRTATMEKGFPLDMDPQTFLGWVMCLKIHYSNIRRFRGRNMKGSEKGGLEWTNVNYRNTLEENLKESHKEEAWNSALTQAFVQRQSQTSYPYITVKNKYIKTINNNEEGGIKDMVTREQAVLVCGSLYQQTKVIPRRRRFNGKCPLNKKPDTHSRETRT